MRLAIGVAWVVAASAVNAETAPQRNAAPSPVQAVAPHRETPIQDSAKLEVSADNLAQMKGALKLVLGRAEQARNEKDVVKLNCVNEKLTQIKALLRVAEQADRALEESLKAKKGGGEAEFSKVAIARTKVDALRKEAEECIGQLAYLVDESTRVEVEQPPLPGGDEGGLGVAVRSENPADSVDDIGKPPPEPTPACTGGGSFCPSPVVRPPAASQFQ